MVSLGFEGSGRIRLTVFQVFWYVRWSATIFVVFLILHCKNKTNVNIAKILDCLSGKKILDQVPLREFSCWKITLNLNQHLLH